MDEETSKFLETENLRIMRIKINRGLDGLSEVSFEAEQDDEKDLAENANGLLASDLSGFEKAFLIQKLEQMVLK